MDTTKILEAIKAWKAQYPQHCPKCEGAGGKTYTSFNRDEPDDYEDCSDCIQQNKCPRCAAYVNDEFCADDKCSQCGWAWGTQPDDVCPQIDPDDGDFGSIYTDQEMEDVIFPHLSMEDFQDQMNGLEF